MADADEDVIRPAHPGIGDHDADEDGEDETFDFRFLSSLNLITSATGALPKRGIKDFEPHPTALQSNTLAASRQAMREALSHTRMHVPKSHVVGVYNAETGLTRVDKIRGQMFRNIGKDVSGGGVDLFPEEALWALERGSLDIRWGTGDAMDEEEGLPMSLQGAYAAFIGEEEEGRGDLTIEKYQVYAGLKRVGYTVLRAEEWGGLRYARQNDILMESPSLGSGLFEWLYGLLVGDAIETKVLQERAGPLVKPGLYRSYSKPAFYIGQTYTNQSRRYLSSPAYNPSIQSRRQHCSNTITCRYYYSIPQRSSTHQFPHDMERLQIKHCLPQVCASSPILPNQRCVSTRQFCPDTFRTRRPPPRTVVRPPEASHGERKRPGRRRGSRLRAPETRLQERHIRCCR